MHRISVSPNNDPSNIGNIPEYGGGALIDIGCYPSLRRGSCSAKSLHEYWGWSRETRRGRLTA
jgi:hypothetical protein